MPKPIKDEQTTEIPASTAPITMLVIDPASSSDNPRTHEQIVDGLKQSFKFEGKPLAMPAHVAAKFLQHDDFKLVDESGTLIPYLKPPRQPDQMQAGEKLVLKKDETVARYDELTNAALLKRALPLPGGERFADNPDRKAVIKFIVETKEKIATMNKSKTPDVGKDDFVPAAELDAA